MILIYPPVAKPGQPPHGIAKLCRALQDNHIRCKIIDGNLEGLLFLLKENRRDLPAFDIHKSLSAIRQLSTYGNLSLYKYHIGALNKFLRALSGPDFVVSLSNSVHVRKKPVSSRHLMWASRYPEKSPFYDYFLNRILPAVEQDNANVLGISLVYLSQALSSFALAGLVRKYFPSIKIVLGGGLITTWMSQPQWKDRFEGLIDHFVSGNGEQALLAYLGCKTNGVVKHYAPDYVGFSENEYLSPGIVLPYMTSTGCYWQKCAFCPEAAEDSDYYPLPGKTVNDDLRNLVKKTEPALIHFMDNALRPAILENFIASPPGAAWYGHVRFEKMFKDLTFCQELKKSGCVMLQLGLESGDQEVLNAMAKGIKLADASIILRNLHQASIGTYVYILFGTPWENEEKARQTMQFVIDNSHNIDYLSPAIFNLPVYSKEAASLQRRDFYEGDLSIYTDFSHPQGWERIRIRHFLSKEFCRNAKISKILQRMPPVFNANHAPFFLMHGRQIA